MLTRDEYLKKGNGSKPPSAAQDPRDYYKILIRDSVAAENVTNNEHWDRFLSLVMGGLNQAQTLLTQQRGVLESPMLVNHDNIMQLKVSMARLEGMKAGLEWVVEIPKAVMESAEGAAEKLKELEEELERKAKNVEDVS